MYKKKGGHERTTYERTDETTIIKEQKKGNFKIVPIFHRKIKTVVRISKQSNGCFDVRNNHDGLFASL